MTEETYECQIHKSFGLGQCAGCQGLDLYQVDFAWQGEHYSTRTVQLAARTAEDALAKARELVGRPGGKLDGDLVGLEIRRLQTHAERAMEVKWSRWEEK